MTQYIDKDALVAEIERIKKSIGSDRFLGEFEKGCNNGKEDVCDDLLSFLNSIEVNEVNFEKELSYPEYQDFFNKYPNLPNDWGFDETWICAKYFYSLGLKAQKGE